ncbi:MAG: hypothetical protein LBT97_14260 [Planctomycetota bacterium]|jgi:hypothetical protein|nr:hypothetical protein [Planctomycetota bacterium]
MKINGAVSKRFLNKFFSDASVKTKFKIFSFFLLLCTFLLGTAAFFLSMRQIGYVSLQDNLSLVVDAISELTDLALEAEFSKAANLIASLFSEAQS